MTNRLALATLLLSLLAVPAFANDPLKIDAVSVGSGETPITSGLAASVDLVNAKGAFVQVMAQSEQGWLWAGWDWKHGATACSAYASIGFFQAAPWAAPIGKCVVTLAEVAGGRKVKIGAFAQPGTFLYRRPLDYRDQHKRTAFFEQAWASVGPLSVSIARLDFLDQKANYLPGVGFSPHILPELEVNASVLWNKNADRAMYFIGATWHPHK